jgi:hypothetical protein
MTKINWTVMLITVALLTIRDIAAEDFLQPVDTRHVTVGGEIQRRMDLTVTGNLLQIDLNTFLGPFHAKNGRGNDTYVGLGKTLDGLVRLAANTQDAALLARKKHVVEELLKTQESDGYIGFMRPESRTWELWDLHEQGYLITALALDYRLCGEATSLVAARKLADYIIARWPGKPADWAKRLPCNEYLSTIGLKRAFLVLYEATSDRKYLDFCVQQLKVKEWSQDIVLGRHGAIEGHSYSYCSHCLAQLELYRLDPDPTLLKPTMRAMEFMLAKEGMGITGGVGHDECWTDQQSGKGSFAETCSTAYQLFLYDQLLRLGGETRWGDVIERTLYNTAFAAQSPVGRRIRYYTPFEEKRGYFNRDTYCCPGNFRRMIATLPEWIYYRCGAGLVVNLYTASQVTFGTGSDTVVVRQETEYPSSSTVTLAVEPARARAFPLLLRVPRWCDRPAASVNGKPVPTQARTGEFLAIERQWQTGDQVMLDLPMPWRFVAGRKDQAGKVAIMRGPLVYTLNPNNIAVSKADATGKTQPTGLDILANHEGWFEQNARKGKPLMVGTNAYVRGLMCHAPSKVVVRLPGPGKAFSAVVGVDANNDTGTKGSVVFSVTVGDKVVFKSDELKGKMEGVPVKVELGGAKEFTLEVSDAGDGISYDQADWVEAKVILADGREQGLGDMPVRDSRPTASSGIDMKRLVLLPDTVELVPNDSTVRPGGTACRIKAGLDEAGQGDYTLILTEFPDPDGQAIYFRIPDPKEAVADELMGPVGEIKSLLAPRDQKKDVDGH